MVEHCIDTGDRRPIRQQLRRHPLAHLEVIDDKVEEMIRHDIIEPAASPWTSNVVLVKKKDGSYRFCVDYRQLNAATYQDAYPLPHIETCLNSLKGASWFTTLDLRAGYHNIPIKESDRDKTAFVTRRGCWRYKVMPFGLTCAPAVFQRLMDLVLCGLSYEACMVYLDDIIIFSADFDSHLERLATVFSRLRWARLKLRADKCFFFRREVSFLGHVVSGHGIAMQPDKVQAVRDWPTPTNLGEMRSFLGLCSYYRRYIKSFADIAAPLHALAKKDVDFCWGPAQSAAFQRLKDALTSAPILGTPRDEGTYVLDTDASDRALGAVLSQKQGEQEVVIAYASRILARPEQHYCITKKELLGVVFGLKTFRQYLLGRRFLIRTDHSALQWLRRTPEPLAQQARWLSLIEEFTFDIQHRPGERHGNADALSRRPEPCKQCTHCRTVRDDRRQRRRRRKRRSVALAGTVDSRLAAVDLVEPKSGRRNEKLHRKTPDETAVVGFFGRRSVFSNFYPVPVSVRGENFPSAEAAYQSAKALHFRDYEAVHAIGSCQDPGDAKRRGKSIKNFDVYEWQQCRENYMTEILRAKFQQHAHCGKVLVDTGRAIIAEMNPHDTYWGTGVCTGSAEADHPSQWPGMNRLGQLLMNVRDELRTQPSAEAAADVITASAETRVPDKGEEAQTLSADISTSAEERLGLQHQQNSGHRRTNEEALHTRVAKRRQQEVEQPDGTLSACRPSSDGTAAAMPDSAGPAEVATSTEERTAQLQQEDPEIGCIVRWRLQSDKRPPIDAVLPAAEASKVLWNLWEWLRVEDGIVYRQLPPKPDRPEVLQLLVPAVLKKELLQRCHENSAGHAGFAKTAEQVQRRAFWLGWRADVRRYCRQCQACQRYHRGKLPRRAELQPIVPGGVCERLNIDLTGPHPRSRRGSVYICTIIEPFTKWAEAYAIPNKEAATVARVIVEQVICRLGQPLAILSDRGREVDGNIMREICRLLGVDKLRTTAYRASTNAAVERLHKSLNSMLGKVVAENQRDWCSYLPYVMAAYRATRHDSTGYTPNYLMLAREVRHSIDIVHGTMPTQKVPSGYDDYAEEVESRMRYAFAFVREHLGRAAERYKYYYDLRLKPLRFHPGDKVLYFNARRFQGRQDKWARKFTGPFTVVRVTGPSNVLLQKTPRSRPFHVHVDKCKPFLAEENEEEANEQASDVLASESLPNRDAVVAPSQESDSETEENAEIIAGQPTDAAGRTPRPRREIRRPRRFCE